VLILDTAAIARLARNRNVVQARAGAKEIA
jgi:hypothetical protein